MNLYEYQAKKLFAKYNLPILKGSICSTPAEAQESVEKTQGPWVGKCQIRSGGRGKSGGVKILKTEKEVESFVEYWLNKNLITYQTDDSGEKVHKILLEPYVSIVRELYLSILIDRNTSKIICLASSKGGIEIESIAKISPNLNYKILLDPLMGPQVYQGRKLGYSLGLRLDQVQHFIKIFLNLGEMFLKHDLMLVEINPLVITDDGRLLCLDAKIAIDDNAIFRQKQIFLPENTFQQDSCIILDNDILNSKLNYIPMEGNIGCIVNGAGLAMATMDLLSLYGGKPANFLDIGGGVTKESVIEAIKIIMYNEKIQVIFINIFGGIVCCNLIAEGIIQALSIIDVIKPIIVRLEGNNAELGNKKLLNSEYRILASNNFLESVQQVVSMVNRLNNVNIN